MCKKTVSYGGHKCTRQFGAVNIPDWKLPFRRAFSLMFTAADRLLLHGDGRALCMCLILVSSAKCECKYVRAKALRFMFTTCGKLQGEGKRKGGGGIYPYHQLFRPGSCKHPTLSCDRRQQRLREGCLLGPAGSDPPARASRAKADRIKVKQRRFIKAHLETHSKQISSTIPRGQALFFFLFLLFILAHDSDIQRHYIQH